MPDENIAVEEIVRGLTSISRQIFNVKSGLDPSDDDARRWRLDGLNNTVAGHVILLGSLRHGRTVAQSRAAIHASNHPNPEWAIHIVTRLGFITQFFFEIDALFQDLLHAIGEPVSLGFFRNARRLVGATNVVSSATSLEVLKVGASIRNCQHAGGIHTHASFSKAIQGTSFEFVEGQECECAGWRHVLIACGEAVTVVEEILRTPEVLAVPFAKRHKLKIPL